MKILFVIIAAVGFICLALVATIIKEEPKSEEIVTEEILLDDIRSHVSDEQAEETLIDDIPSHDPVEHAEETLGDTPVHDESIKGFEDSLPKDEDFSDFTDDPNDVPEDTPEKYSSEIPQEDIGDSPGEDFQEDMIQMDSEVAQEEEGNNFMENPVENEVETPNEAVTDESAELPQVEIGYFPEEDSQEDMLQLDSEVAPELEENNSMENSVANDNETPKEFVTGESAELSQDAIGNFPEEDAQEEMLQRDSEMGPEEEENNPTANSVVNDIETPKDVLTDESTELPQGDIGNAPEEDAQKEMLQNEIDYEEAPEAEGTNPEDNLFENEIETSKEVVTDESVAADQPVEVTKTENQPEPDTDSKRPVPDKSFEITTRSQAAPDKDGSIKIDDNREDQPIEISEDETKTEEQSEDEAELTSVNDEPSVADEKTDNDAPENAHEDAEEDLVEDTAKDTKELEKDLTLKYDAKEEEAENLQIGDFEL